MYNKGDTTFRNKPKRLSLDNIRLIPIMLNDYAEKSGRKSFSICFHGGEPLLVGVKYFAEVMNILTNGLKNLDIAYSVQTNATLINDAWIDLLETHQISVSASLDGPSHINGKNRIYASGKDSTTAAISGIRRIQDSAVKFGGVLCVVQPFSSGTEVVEFFVNDLRLKWFDLLLPDFTHDSIPENWPEQQASFATFLVEAFDTWFPHSSRNVACRFFDSVIARLVDLDSQVDTIGINGLSAIVLETDGTLEPHDALRVCNSFDRRTGIHASPTAYSDFLSHPVFRLVRNEEEVFANECLNCNHFQTCRGGHFMHRYSQANLFRNPSVHCATLKKIVSHITNVIGERLIGSVSEHDSIIPNIELISAV